MIRRSRDLLLLPLTEDCFTAFTKGSGALLTLNCTRIFGHYQVLVRLHILLKSPSKGVPSRLACCLIVSSQSRFDLQVLYILLVEVFSWDRRLDVL